MSGFRKIQTDVCSKIWFNLKCVAKLTHEKTKQEKGCCWCCWKCDTLPSPSWLNRVGDFVGWSALAGVWFHKTKTNSCHRRELPIGGLFPTPARSTASNPPKTHFFCTHSSCFAKLCNGFAAAAALTIIYF